MASQVLKKGQAVVQVPPRSIGERAFATEACLLAALPGAPAGAWIRSSLDALPPLRAVTLLFDARDVTLLRVKLPPLSGARLRQAVPNAVEDLLLQDPQQCAFALGPAAGDGERLVAVIDRSWLEFVVSAFERRGKRVLAAWPAQLALPIEGDAISISCANDGVTLRSGRLEGLGWQAGRSSDERRDALVALLETTLGQTAIEAHQSTDGAPAISDDQSPRRVLACCEDPQWHPALDAAARSLRLAIELREQPLPSPAPIDLLTARPGTRAARAFADVDWRAWRLPAALAGASALIALLGLNLHWGLMARERDGLRQAVEMAYRRAFPEARVIVDPVLQMERQVASMRAQAGQAGPEDFLPLMTRFSQALGAQTADVLAGVEYRDGRLRVRFQPGRFEARELRDGLMQTCQRFGLALRFDAEREPTATVALLR